MDHPSIGVVVVNYNGGDLTLACLRSVLDSSWPPRLRVVLVDNASEDGVVARVRAELPAVEVLENLENVGFGAGCNRGIRAAGDVDYVALVNNDATVEPGWLRPLVAALETDPGVGAACPKILFAGRYRYLELPSATTSRGRGDHRDLGVLLGGARVDDADVWRRVHLVDGTWGVEPDHDDGAQWTGAVAHLRVPLPHDAGAATASLLLSADTPRAVELRSGDVVVTHTVGPEPAWFDVPTRGPGIQVVNNAGTELGPGGFGVDRGFQEPDDGSYDVPIDVFAWCGAAVLLRAEYLDDVGLFDEDLFLYYEDLELAWRGSSRGWRYRYVPTSVAHHVHAASSVSGSAFKRYFDERNHLLVLSRHGAPTDAARAIGRSLLVTASYARRDLIAPMLTGRSPHAQVVQARLRAWGGFVRRLPGALTRRRHDRRTPRSKAT
jgi:GT2 family glycosyltransferase